MMGQSDARLSPMMRALLGPSYVAWYEAATVREAERV